MEKRSLDSSTGATRSFLCWACLLGVGDISCCICAASPLCADGAAELVYLLVSAPLNLNNK